jgi:hypothetical protein
MTAAMRRAVQVARRDAHGRGAGYAHDYEPTETGDIVAQVRTEHRRKQKREKRERRSRR